MKATWLFAGEEGYQDQRAEILKLYRSMHVM